MSRQIRRAAADAEPSLESDPASSRRSARVISKEIEFHAPRDALAAGIGMVHQHFRLAASFTVAENFALGAHDRRGLAI